MNLALNLQAHTPCFVASVCSLMFGLASRWSHLSMMSFTAERNNWILGLFVRNNDIHIV